MFPEPSRSRSHCPSRHYGDWHFRRQRDQRQERRHRVALLESVEIGPTARVVDPSVFESASHHNDDSDNNSDCERAQETRMVLSKINARRLVHAEYAINNFELEPLEGYVVKLERGKLGLVRHHSK